MPRIVQQAVDLIAGDTWPKRRLVINGVLCFCAAIITCCLGAAIAAKDMGAVITIANASFGLGGTTAISYIFGANADDKDKRKHLPSATPPTPPEGGE